MKFALCFFLFVCISYSSARRPFTIKVENSWKHVESEAEFDEEVRKAGDKLVVIDFFATWCGPCKAITPFLEKLAPKYPNVVMLKADIDIATDLALRFSVSAMPTFFFLKSGDKVDQLVGADVNKFESIIIKHAKKAA